MECADLAEEARRTGDNGAYNDHIRSAMENEIKAAEQVRGEITLEPTRSVLHRSAASLALECGDLRIAEKLIATALSGEPPDEIAEELRDLLENVHFQRHLAVRNIKLQPEEFQMSLEGVAVGFGITRADHILARAQDLEKLIYRTVERYLGKKFRETGRRNKSLSEESELYVSVPRAASMAMTFKIGHSNQPSLPEINLPGAVIDELLNCIELVDSGDMNQLQEQISDDLYFQNFIGLARKIAPDGEKIRTVGFTSLKSDTLRKVAFRRARSEIRIVAPGSGEDDSSTTSSTIRGTLLAADATSQQKGRIKIIDSEKKPHTVFVSRGMMSDIVKPYFEEYVVAIVRSKAGKCILESIDPDENTP